MNGLSTEQAQAYLIDRLQRQLNLAGEYIRRHVEGNPSYDERFMLFFAEGCIQESNLSEPTIKELWNVLTSIEIWARGYLNSLHTTGKADTIADELLRDSLKQYSAIIYPDGHTLSWVDTK